ncbi:acyltransferase family protein [Planktothrix mougeotii]|uniref:DUF1624 domain-containing protein n=1 Tax=Planktothrix mougeotii LEGE 06226 TaxID=1828728 RepID=A0ABR9U6C4_9CYAN|nr:heparan-alpha-glucosaminide N-acetyltransferase domain-containing protein [Planktothrix mougeotii]MBE9142013.1 DUF1624 domain-containing protein [Planktothrix mougeotii LEGE 06226]
MRLQALDVFRGIAIASMILVNNPGSWDFVYPLLNHAEWNGCTPTDLVFPFFLFIVGVAMAFSLLKYTKEYRSPETTVPESIYWRIAKRCGILFLLGLLLNGFPTYNLTQIRIMGVLQRISVAYFLAAIAIFNLSKKGLWILSAAILVGYWIALQYIPVPGYGAGNLTPEGNFAAYIDRILLGQNHLWKGGVYDPEGLFSTFPAVVTVLAGYLTGNWIRKQPIRTYTSISLIVFAISCFVVGYLWAEIFPLNKSLWTSSFTTVTVGWSLLLLAFCYETLEVRGWTKWGFPFKVMGLNALFIFVASGFVARLLNLIKIGNSPEAPSAKTWLYETVFQSIFGPMNGSLAFAIATLLFWWVISYFMYRQQWFVKV